MVLTKIQRAAGCQVQARLARRGARLLPLAFQVAANGRGVGRDIRSDPVHGEVHGGTKGKDGV